MAFSKTALAVSCAVLAASPSSLVCAFVAPSAARGLLTAAGRADVDLSQTATVGRRPHVLMR